MPMPSFISRCIHSWKRVIIAIMFPFQWRFEEFLAQSENKSSPTVCHLFLAVVIERVTSSLSISPNHHVIPARIFAVSFAFKDKPRIRDKGSVIIPRIPPEILLVYFPRRNRPLCVTLRERNADIAYRDKIGNGARRIVFGLFLREMLLCIL